MQITNLKKTWALEKSRSARRHTHLLFEVLRDSLRSDTAGEMKDVQRLKP